MDPAHYRAGGKGERLRVAVGESTLGAVLVAATERGVCAILLGHDGEMLLRELQDLFPNAVIVAGDAGFRRWVGRAITMVNEPEQAIDLPLDIRGTAFQQRVWDELRRIPAGTTTTYTSLAKKIGRPKAVRAVASACASNRIAIAIPCHRVIRLSGNPAGYRWGLERKKELLQREAQTAKR